MLTIFEINEGVRQRTEQIKKRQRKRYIEKETVPHQLVS